MVDIAPATRGMADCYARMAKIASDALDDREKAVELWGRVVDSARRRPDRAVAAWPICTSMAARVARADRRPGASRSRDATIPSAQSRSTSASGRIWGEKLWRERNSLESWQKVLEIDPQDVEALRAIAANYQQRGRWEELSRRCTA